MSVTQLAARYPQLLDGNRLPPDAVRYFVLADGGTVSRPFHLRWLLPALLGTDLARWSRCWIASGVVAAGGMVWWRLEAGATWQAALAAAVFLSALPGILGASPVSVDLPALAVTVIAVAMLTNGHPALVAVAVVFSFVAGSIKESAPVWIAVTAWSPIPLVGLLAVAARAVWCKPGADPIGGKFQWIADHPVKAGLEAHAGRWRDARLMVIPWGVCLAGLVSPSWPLIVVLCLAYGQLLGATDTVRLVHHSAGPAMAATAASQIPERFLLLAVVVHGSCWFQMERV